MAIFPVAALSCDCHSQSLSPMFLQHPCAPDGHGCPTGGYFFAVAFQLPFDHLSLVQGNGSISWKTMSHSDCVIWAESASSLKGGSCVSGLPPSQE